MKRHIIMFLAAFVLAVQANAAPVVINISGQVINVFDLGGFLDGAISAGDSINGTYIYESTTPDINPGPNVGFYPHATAPSGITLNVGGLVFRTDPTLVSFLVELRNGPSEDGHLLLSINNIFPKSVPGPLNNAIFWQLIDPTGIALSSDALPTQPPALADWPSNNLVIASSNGIDAFAISAQVTSAVFIPEPSSSLLLCAGLSCLLAYRLWVGGLVSRPGRRES